MFSKFLKPKIDVEFIDAKTNKIFAKSRVPIDQLPKSFAPATTMHLGDEDWQVVSAAPTNYEEIKKAKRLQLILQKITWVNLNDILYLIPTLSEDIIHLNGIKYIQNVVNKKEDSIFIHSDDWRQIEFIPQTQLAEVNKEFESINIIYQAQIKNGSLSGFKNIHVRSLIPDPVLNMNLTTDDIISFFKPRLLKQIASPEPENIIANGFYYELSDNVSIYGIIQENNAIKFIGLLFSKIPDAETVAKIIIFCDKYDLMTVDWLRMSIIKEKTV